MKKLYTTLVTVFAIVQFSYGQWTGTTDIYNTNSGNVGIGTPPDTKFHILEPSDSKPAGSVAATKSILKFSRSGTGNYSYSESAEFRIGHGGPAYWGSKLDLYINGSNNQSNVPDQQVMTWLYNGNVGIGTVNPVSALNVAGTTGLTWGQNVSGLLTIGNFGTGGSLWVNTQSLSNAWPSGLGIDGTYSSAISTLNIKAFGVNSSGWGSNLAFSITQNGSLIEAMRIDNSGNVGIGTTTPHEALSVNGNIRSKEVKVEAANWPDFVFKKQYKLPSLLSVKNFIDQNHHLPDMPSEQEVKENGLNLGEIVKLQTKKLEELTLYAIDQQKQIDQLKQQLTSLTKAITKN